MFPDRDFDPKRSSGRCGSEVLQDLGLEAVLSAMSRGDPFLHEVAKVALSTAFENEAAVIRHRQEVLEDCLANPMVIRELRALAVEAKEMERKQSFWRSKDWPSHLLYNSIQVMHLFMDKLRVLRRRVVQIEDGFDSSGFRNLFAMLKRELSDDYFAEVSRHLDALRFRDGVLVSVGLGAGNRATGYVLRRPPRDDRNWILRQLFPRRIGGLKLTINSRDEAGWRIYSGLRDRGEALAAAALARSADHISDFFRSLLTELAFYEGALSLHETLKVTGVITARPAVRAMTPSSLHFRGLYDICLALVTKHAPTGNDMQASEKTLVIVTGANQGGKSTFLRSLGQAQIMMQAGLFVPALSFDASIVAGLFTHFKREEDSSLKSGKLDEELARMNAIVDEIQPDSLLLLNESFSSTNAREGSEIARQITMALVESGVRVAFVTHLHEYARAVHEAHPEKGLFLRAERREDGTRTFRMIEGPPLSTSWGEDLYRRIFSSSEPLPTTETREENHA